jgi:hypothetical protein
MNDAERDAARFAHYDEAANLEPAPGPARKLKRPARSSLSEYVPIRLSPEALAAVKHHADQDGITVSAWIRRAVDRELGRTPKPRRRSGQAQPLITESIERVIAQLIEIQRAAGATAKRHLRPKQRA